jgi:hypothetical protein
MDRSYLKGTDGDKMNAILERVVSFEKAPTGYSLACFQRAGTAQSIADTVHLAPLGRLGVD